MAAAASEAEKNGVVNFIPDRFIKIYQNWLNNIHDWCISRQLWWGHRIPAYYCDECGETVVAREMPEKCPKCGSYMVEKGNKLVCGNEQCGFVKNKEKDEK